MTQYRSFWRRCFQPDWCKHPPAFSTNHQADTHTTKNNCD